LKNVYSQRKAWFFTSSLVVRHFDLEKNCIEASLVSKNAECLGEKHPKSPKIRHGEKVLLAFEYFALFSHNDLCTISTEKQKSFHK